MSFAPEYLKGDSTEYETLLWAASAIRGVPGLTCELGLREGGGTEAILRGLMASADLRWHVAVDPYGALPYPIAEGYMVEEPDYNGAMRRQTLAKLFSFAADRCLDVLYFPLTDKEFFRCFPIGVPIYEGGEERLENRYALVHFDAQHDLCSVHAQCWWFLRRTPVGGLWVFDDVDYYPHDDLRAMLSSNGFRLVRDGAKKKAYRRENQGILDDLDRRSWR